MVIIAVFFTVYLIWMVAFFQAGGSIITTFFGQLFTSFAVILLIVIIFYSLPRLLGFLLDRYSSKSGSQADIEYAMGEYRLNQLREEGKKVDGQMYYQ